MEFKEFCMSVFPEMTWAKAYDEISGSLKLIMLGGMF